MAFYIGSQKVCPIVQVGTTPTGTLSITANGVYDVTNYASANVSVSGDISALYAWSPGSGSAYPSAYTFTPQPLEGSAFLYLNNRQIKVGTVTSDSDGETLSVTSESTTGTFIRDVRFDVLIPQP